MKPRIGITSEPDEAGLSDEAAAWRSYAAAIDLAGGEPVFLDAGTLGREAEVLDQLDGLLLSGGRDIDLSMYPNPRRFPGEELSAVMERFRMRPEPERDAYELPLVNHALERDLPVLGVCRGCQVMNVALGGRLILDIPLETGTPLRHASHPAPDGRSSFHTVHILPETLLAEILPPELATECNSRHHQAVLLDETFTARVAAISPEDGIVEAIEVPGKRWAIGVQWHPEHPRDEEVRRAYAPLFRAFVESASE